ncbi:kinase-like domain-containing protein [Lasiosphaeria hispida]|uniref:Kinase-like domain-containing protein n=1 Tax=Lasiosphaeria hispida TaxID=260671 RepID=A0AAJ0MGK5_9PEZI|nr:kinase-like domain-containing protein [Lasiosphaeria hispida]
MSSEAVASVSFEDRSTQPPKTGRFWVFPHQTIKIGRDPDSNALVFTDASVSRNHLEFFSIIVDEEPKHSPLVFVRDRQSCNGTHHNGRLVGKGPIVSPAALLQNGDVVTMAPHIKFRFTQLAEKVLSFGLCHRQRRELKLFEDKFIVSDRTIGDGAHAVVYLATEVKTGEQVVCKVHSLRRGPHPPSTLQRIRQEAILMSYLDHPNVLSIKAAFQTHQTMYIFTELATGGDLFSLFARYITFKELEIRWVIWQVLRGVAYIHSKGVAHRDIKPENILCAIAPDVSYRIMLSDFGDSAMASGGRMRSEVGTTFYRAPECHTPEQGHNLSVDIWAIGMLTLQLFVGSEELPEIPRMGFRNKTQISQYLDNVLSCIRESHTISENGDRFIRACLIHDKEARPTAQQALEHRWFREPKADRALFKTLEVESRSSWRHRDIVLPVVEDLTSQTVTNDNWQLEQVGAATDTISPHFRFPQPTSPPVTDGSGGGFEQPSKDMAAKDVVSSGHARGREMARVEVNRNLQLAPQGPASDEVEQSAKRKGEVWDRGLSKRLRR